MYTLKVQCGDNVYILDDGTYGVLQGHDGWGMAPQHRLSERGAQQHGDTDYGFRMDPRFGLLVFRFPTYLLDTMHIRRRKLVRIFAPQNSPVLQWDFDGVQRSIDVHYAGEMTFPWVHGDWASQQFSLRLKGPDPRFYDPVQKSATWTLDPPVASLVLTYTLPYIFAASAIDETQAVTYAGDVDGNPVITIEGPITNPIVTNETTDETLELEYVVPAGEVVTIDTRYGQKGVTLSDGTRLVLTDDSDLGTFHLAAATDGSDSNVNTLAVFGTGALDGVTEVAVSWYDRYGGI